MFGKKIGLLCVISVLSVGIWGCQSADPQIESGKTEQRQDLSGQLPEDPQKVPADGLMTVHFLDVGQGNSVLVECDGHYMLIDGGDYETVSYVTQYLSNQGVETLDYIVVSHYDSDHLSGCVGAMRAFTCEQVICPDYEGDTKTYDAFVDDLEKYEIVSVHPNVGETYTLGDALFTIVCPESCDHSDENENSVGLKLEYGQSSFLICGDASEESEEDMIESGIDLSVDVYLASHHGSSGASTYDFLQAVQPKEIVISCGYDNSYGHPAKATMNRLKKTGADLYRTDLQGVLVAVCDGTDIVWNVEPSNDFRCGEDVAADASASKPETAVPNTDNANAASSTAQNQSAKTTYILNTNSGKFHLPSCSSVDDMKQENRKEIQSTVTEMEAMGYQPCKRCLE